VVSHQGRTPPKAAIEKSPRHGEYVDVKVEGREKPVKAYVVFPEVKDKAPVVIVIHEIFGLSDWIKGVTDQLRPTGSSRSRRTCSAARGPRAAGRKSSRAAIRSRRRCAGSRPDEALAALNAVRDYGMKLPASNGKTATIGFCWGGGKSFEYATKQPELNAAVVYYGTSPKDDALANVKAPVMGFYGGNDNRVNSTIKPAEEALKKAGKEYTPHIYDGAGHGFLRQQDGQEGANMKATQQAWPETVKFIREKTK
jgi:carboxymethylenebutenolidase